MSELQNVNSMKLTKLEKKVLIALTHSPNKDKYDNYPEGNNINGIAKIVYNSKAFDGGYVRDSVKSSLSRMLNNCVRKGLIWRCVPVIHYYWENGEGDPDGCKYNSSRLEYLKRTTTQDENKFDFLKIDDKFMSLPYNTRVWWMLTEKGRTIVDKWSVNETCWK